jgi:predicted enzyme related to lactoylglutathione lyase
MTNIRAVIANVPVADLDAATPLYEALTGVHDVKRFSYEALELASIGPFLLYSGRWGDHPHQVATVIVESVASVISTLELSSGTILEGPDSVPNGTRILALHPDGSVFEYLQPRQQ